MTESERKLIVEKCGKLLQDVLVEIRALSWEDGHSQQINDLADLTHNIPQFMVGRDDFVLKYLRSGFAEYVLKYFPNTPLDQHRYIELLDMDETTFRELYCRTSWAWPESAVAVG